MGYLINNNGFSPSQLVFGRNCNLPSTLSDTLSELDNLLDKHLYPWNHLIKLNLPQKRIYAITNNFLK